MTKTFTYTFRRQNEEVTLTKKVTDAMEERNTMKAGYAADYFNRVLREKYGYRKSPVRAWLLKEVKS